MTHPSDRNPDRQPSGSSKAPQRSRKPKRGSPLTPEPRAVPAPVRKPRPEPVPVPVPVPVATLCIPSAPSAAPAFDARLDELARSAGASRHGETPAPRPLPDAALVMGLTLQFARLSGRVPAPLLDGLRRLSESGEPTSRMLLGWLRRQSEADAQDRKGRTAR